MIDYNTNSIFLWLIINLNCDDMKNSNEYLQNILINQGSSFTRFSLILISKYSLTDMHSKFIIAISIC